MCVCLSKLSNQPFSVVLNSNLFILTKVKILWDKNIHIHFHRSLNNTLNQQGTVALTNVTKTADIGVNVGESTQYVTLWCDRGSLMSF